MIYKENTTVVHALVSFITKRINERIYKKKILMQEYLEQQYWQPLNSSYLDTDNLMCCIMII